MLPIKLKNKNVCDFKIDLKIRLTPNRYNFCSKGNNYKSSLLTRIRVGRSFLKEHSFTLGFFDSMSCYKCMAPCESPLHYINQCEEYSSFRLIILNKVKQVIPNIHLLAKKRQYEILVHSYNPDNDELVRYNTKILIATQDFIYDTKRFCDKNKPSVPPHAQAPVPLHAPLPASPRAPLPAPPI